jgi:hypothetical protein
VKTASTTARLREVEATLAEAPRVREDVLRLLADRSEGSLESAENAICTSLTSNGR